MWLKTFCVQKSTHCVSVWDSIPLKVIEELNRADSPLLPPGFWSLNSGARLSAWSVWYSTVRYLVVGRRWLLFLSTALKKNMFKSYFSLQLCMCTFACGICTHLRVPLCSEDDVRSSGARGTVVCAAQHGCWESNSDPLQVLLHGSHQQ